jgi:catechol 2,3-dioxygenase-like lactoylglutathione lyase family enzyme
VIDHLYLPVTNVERSRSFYRELLQAIGVEETFTRGASAVFGAGGPGAFWIYPMTGRTEGGDFCGQDPEARTPLAHLHVAFRVTSRQQVIDFVSAARAVGAEIVSPPQLHPQYHASYFSAFVRDPDGHSIEAVCHGP